MYITISTTVVCESHSSLYFLDHTFSTNDPIFSGFIYTTTNKSCVHITACDLLYLPVTCSMRAVIGLSSSTWAINPSRKNLVRDLQCGPQTQLVRGMS